MLDALINAAHVKLKPEDGGEAKVLRFVTKHNWIDRIHHYVVSFASTNPAWRLHSLHIPRVSGTSQSIEICPRQKTSSLRPRFCNHPDDYRYERDTVQTNLVEWYTIIAVLRGGAQAGYVVAQVLDSSFMDIFLDSYWAAVGGSIHINLVTFLRSTAVQMRNVWLLALFVTVAVLAIRKTRAYSGEALPAIRGLVITFTSTLTVFGPYKKTTQRDTNITSLFLLPDESQTMDIVHGNPLGHYNVSTYFFDDSAVMLLFCIGVVVLLAGAVWALDSSSNRVFLGLFHRRNQIRPRASLRNFPGDSVECRSIVQLMNIAMMTDPWNFFWLRVLGIQLYLYSRLSSTSGAMRSTFYNYEALEIVVLTRGRRCTAGSCTTVFVDDYRYERDIVQTNLVDCFTDIFLDSYWASVGGSVNIQWLPFIQTTSVQMRGVWALALFATVVLFAMRLRHQDGIPGVRGLLISFTSSLTVFGPYKSLYYRDMNIVDIFRIPDEGPIMDIVRSSNPGAYFNSSSYFYGGTSKTLWGSSRLELPGCIVLLVD
eukprot:jgi/Phyca11/20686/fgenesh1_pg.PHYCAscaffold_71_\